MAEFKYNKDTIKNSLTIDQVFSLVAELGGEPLMGRTGDYFTARTICHNVVGEGSRKLYYYDNTKLFKCFTDCNGSFDIFELVQKVKNVNGEHKTGYTKEGLAPREWQMYDAVEFVAIYYGFAAETNEFEDTVSRLEDWAVFGRYDRRQQKQEVSKKVIELKVYDSEVLTRLPQPHIASWEREGITREVMLARGIAFNPRTESIVIPHYNMQGDLVGIRERTLIKEEEIYGKYKPAILNGIMYNHPLGFNLYNLNNSYKAIQIMKKAIVFEGEKSPLLYASYFGMENDITVATCGNSLISSQVQLLLSLGVEEIIIAYDKQFKEIGDAEWKRLTDNYYNMHKKYGAYVQLSFLFDKGDLLGYKDSPIDQGKDIFMKLYQERITI